MSARANLTHAIEDYLKEIYDLTANGGAAATNAIADRLGVAPASVTAMLKRLAAADPPLIDYQKSQGAALTEAGRSVALEIVRHHRLLETYLHQVLGYPWDEVHAEADRLEHVISEAFEEKIAAALGHPERDPHGDPIPARDLTLPALTDAPLSALHAGQRATITRVRDSAPALLRHLQTLGVVPQARVTVLAASEFDGNLTLQVETMSAPIVLGPAITMHVFVVTQ